MKKVMVVGVLLTLVSVELVSATTVTLQGGKYRVSIPQAQGVVPLDLPGDGQVLFHFGNRTDPVILVKVLNGCARNGHFWVFVASTAMQHYSLTVSGPAGSWTVPRQDSAEPVVHTEAFAQGCIGHTGNDDGVPLPDTSPTLAMRGRFDADVRYFTATGGWQRAQAWTPGPPYDGFSLFYFSDATDTKILPHDSQILLKVVDRCATTGHWWVQAAGTTELALQINVNDIITGINRSYGNTGAHGPTITDRTAFPCSAPPPDGDGGADPGWSVDTLTLHAQFEARVRYLGNDGWRGASIVPADLPGTSSGLFYFFSPDNSEILFKLLDGCSFNDHWWVFAAAATNLGFEIQVRERATEKIRLYENEAGKSPPAISDVAAFPCSSQ